ncbi:MAG: type II toxin-antitoxin system Phd/YefM family antitoxin [Nitrospirae bacterium]|nr:type II toxin-antitoxin system Phd/YefM family antitoxin [Nitrospirota bacterium]
MRATAFRANLYKIIETIADTGVPVDVELKGKTVRIVPIESRRKLDRLVKHPDYLKCDPDDVVHMDWSEEWKP